MSRGDASIASLPARLATGDWVVLAHADQGLGFLGKVTDGEWDRRDDALLRARVDTTRTKPIWFAAGDLERIEPSDEADLVEAALERGLVPADRAARLRADLTRIRERTLTFVRSPGLLDRLWAALPIDPEQRSGGLAAFFDEGRRALRECRDRRYALIPPGRAVELPTAEPEPAPPPAPSEEWISRVQTYEEAVVRILDVLPFDELWTVRTRLLGDGPIEAADADSTRTVVLQGLLTAAPSLPALLDALPEGTLERLLPLLGYAHLRSGRRRLLPLAAHLLGVLRWPPPPVRIASALPAPVSESLSKVPDRPLPPTSLEEATSRILGVVPGRQLLGLCDRLGVARPASGDFGSARAAIVRAGPPPRELLAALPPGAMDHLPFLLGLPKVNGTEAEIAAHVLARLEPRLGAAVHHLRLLLDLLPAPARLALVRDHGAPVLPESATFDDQIAALQAAHVTPLDLLSALLPGELARAVQRFGLAGAPDPLTELRALFSRLAPPGRSRPGAPAPTARPTWPERWPGEGRAVWRLLALVRRGELLGVCARLGESFRDSPSATCQELASRVRLAELIRALPEEGALLAARLLGRPGATLDHLGAQLHAVAMRGEPLLPAWPSPRVAPELLLTSIVRPMDTAQRLRLVATLGSAAVPMSAPTDLGRQLLAGGHGLREVLGTFDDVGLTTAAASCGLTVEGESPVWLHALLLLLDLSTQPPPEAS